MANFATRLKELREEHGLLQKELAEKIGAKRGTVAAWETGRMPERMALEKLARLFDTSMDYLMGNTDTRDIPGNANEPTPAEIEDVIRKADLQFDGAPLSAEDKEDIIGFVRLALKNIKRNKT